MKDTAIVMYSHSSYSDAWGMFFGQIDKYIPYKVPRYIICDKWSENIPSYWNCITYDEGLDYAKRVSTSLRHVKEKYCIFHHEDMPLHKQPDLEKIEKYNKILDKNDDISYIKLVRGGLYEDIKEQKAHKESETLYELESDHYFLFAVQPSMWKTEHLEKVYKTCKIEHIREFELVATEICKYFKVKGLYHFAGENKRGLYHWDSDVYPYVATAIVKGKWNISEYNKELIPLTEEYNVDVYKRGIV
tara:strand:- start:9913 stop:10650 length:738 start_codon:yes stop_codon:yes gene_type:complete